MAFWFQSVTTSAAAGAASNAVTMPSDDANAARLLWISSMATSPVRWRSGGLIADSGASKPPARASIGFAPARSKSNIHEHSCFVCRARPLLPTAFAKLPRELKGDHMGAFFSLVYGVVVYVLFIATFLYAIGFVGNVFVPKSIDTGASGSLAQALVADLSLLAVFAIQHS